LRVRHHWAVRTILHASNEENPVAPVMASIVVRPGHAAAARALPADLSGKLAAPPEIFTCAGADAA